MPGVTLGDTVAGYRIDAVAGRGAMGVVYKATQLRLGRTVAFKAIVPELAADNAYRARFERESRVAASIEHPNVLPVYEAGELEDGSLFLVMRWVEGIDLGSLLTREGRLAPHRAVELLVPVARALGAAHAHELVHRDVKPANVLVSRPGEAAREHVYLADFGIARAVEVDDALTRTGMFVGTIAYAAPERLAGEPGSPASDIYALGCVLFEALTGHRPFVRENQFASMHAHLHDPPPFARREVAGVPERLDEVIQVAMSKQPAARFATAEELADAMEGALASTVASPVAERVAASRSLTETIASPGLLSGAGRRRGPWIAGGLAVAVVVALVLVLQSSGGGRPRAGSTGVHRTPAGGAGPALRVTSILELGAGHTPGAVAPLRADVVVVDPVAGRILIAHSDGRPRSPVAVGRRPDAIAADPAGRVWVADSGSGDVRVVDPLARRTLATVGVGPAPAAITIGGGFAWVADRQSNDVRRISLRTLRRSGPPIATRGSGAAGIAYDAAAGTVWVANRASSDVTAIRAGRAAAPSFVAGVPESIAASAGAWIGTASGAVVHLDQSGRTVGSLALHAGRVLVSAVGDVVWVLTSDDARLGRIVTTDPNLGQARARTPLSSAQAPAALSCAAHVCVVADPPTLSVFAAGF